MDSRLDPIIPIPLITWSGSILFRSDIHPLYFPCLFLISFFSKKEERQENYLRVLISNFFCDSILFIKARDHLIFPVASMTGSIKMVLGSVSTLGRSATYNITKITVYVKSWFAFIEVLSFVLPVSFLVYTFSYHSPIFLLLIRGKNKRRFKEGTGNKIWILSLLYLFMYFPLFSFEKI